MIPKGLLNCLDKFDTKIWTIYKQHAKKCRSQNLLPSQKQILSELRPRNDLLVKVGTVMGTPAGPAYANLFFAIHENRITRKHHQLIYAKRYIDNIFGIWIHHQNKYQDNLIWHNFKKETNNFGILKWVFSQRCLSVQFLDLRISIKENQKIETMI